MNQQKEATLEPIRIDVDKVIRSKNPKLEKMLPGFIKRYLKKTLHQEEMNSFLERNKDRKNLDFVNQVLKEFGAHIKVKGEENIPLTGGCIFAANHPLGGLDGLAFMSVVGERRPDIKFVVNDILMNLGNIKDLFVPVNKLGRNTPETFEKIEQIYKSDNAVLIFPAGLVSRKQEKGIQDLQWKKSFITLAKKYHRNIIPVFIEGRNSKFFYELAYWRKKAGIKANLEMFYLVDEMYKQKNKTITLTFGQPIAYTVFDDTKTDGEWADKMKEYLYAMGEGRIINLKE